MKTTFIILLITSIAKIYSLDIATYNIRNFDYDERSRVSTNKQKLKTTLKELNSDLIAVQEINEDQIFKHFIKTHFPDYSVILSECGGAHGQKLGFIYNRSKLILKNFTEDKRTSNPSQQHPSACHNGSRPIAIAEFHSIEEQKNIIALSVHLKSGGRRKSIEKRFQQLNIISKLVKSYQQNGNKTFIIMGDFNSTEYIKKSTEYYKFKTIFQDLGLIDLASKIKCSSYWWGNSDDGYQYPSLLDHIIVSTDLVRNPDTKAKPMAHCEQLECSITSEYDMGISFNEVSDHCPLTSKL